MTDRIQALTKNAGPLSVEELQRKGPITRDEIEAIYDRGALGIAATDEELNIIMEYHSRVRRADHLPTMLNILYPNAEWSLPSAPGVEPMASGFHQEVIDALVWDPDNALPKPTFAELDKLRPYVQDILDQSAYIELRRVNMPREDSLVRALWEYVVEGNREAVDALQARRLAVKKRFPKPENKHWMIQSEEYLKIIPNSPEDILRDLDEAEAKKIAFSPHLEGSDAEPLATRISLEERMAKVLAKRTARGASPEEVLDHTVTIADIDAEKARLESEGE